MERKRDRMMFMGSYYDGLIDLTGEDFEVVTKALLTYMFCDEEPELTGLRKSLFLSFRPVVDISKAKSESGKLGGSKPKANLKQTEANPKQTESKSEANLKQTEANANEEKRREEKGREEKGSDEEEKRSDEEEKRSNTAGKPAKHKYGEYQHVLLTDEEREKLADEYGEETLTKCIRKLDEYIEETGKRYKSHYLTIRRWVVDAVRRDAPKRGSNIFLDMMEDEGT